MNNPRTLGPSDMMVPPIIFGAMARQQTEDGERIALFHQAVELGLTCFDTAPLYDFGKLWVRILPHTGSCANPLASRDKANR